MKCTRPFLLWVYVALSMVTNAKQSDRGTMSFIMRLRKKKSMMGT